MLFVIHPAAMNGTEAVLNALDAILGRAESDVHEIEIVEADELEASGWYQSSRPKRREALKEIARTSIYRCPRNRGPHRRKVEVKDKNSAGRAKDIAHTPLLVLLENAISDGALVAAALRTFAAPQTRKLCFDKPAKLDPPSLVVSQFEFPAPASAPASRFR